MKKILLSIAFALIISVTALAVDLNPFAYGLKSQYDSSSMILSVDFSLNAPASYMRLSIYDGETEVWYKEYFASSYVSGKIPKNTYHEDISVADLPKEKALTWRVDVKGFGRANVEKVDQEYYLYHPSSIDIDNNPENENFGTIFCVEGLNNLHTSRTPDSKYSAYLSYGDGAGLYVFDAAFEHQKTKAGSNGYNGGIDFSDVAYSINTKTAYSPRRVRVSKDGRIFVSTQVLVGDKKTVLWEVNKDLGSADWSTVMSGSYTNHGATGQSAEGNFYAAPNVAFDVYGEGENLKIAMVSGTEEAWAYWARAYRLSVYHLGTKLNNPIISTGPIDYFDNISGTVMAAYDASQVEFDNEASIWYCQGRVAEASPNYPSLIHFNTNKQPDLVERRLGRQGGAFRFNKDHSKVIISGQTSIGSSISGVATKSATTQCTAGIATIYSVSRNENGVPALTAEKNIDMSTMVGNSKNINDFVWDYADNIYAVSHIKEKVAVWAMPYDANKVISTPVASQYEFTINCIPGTYCTVTTILDPEEGGTITCSLAGNARGAGVLSVESCAELTLTAIPEKGYKFLHWTDGQDNIVSTDPQYTFFVTDDITLIAKFDYATYTGITWHNLFLNGEDIAKESADYPSTNERLWRLFQNEYNAYQKSIGQGWQYSPLQKNNQWQVLAFFIAGNNKEGTGNVQGTDIWGFLNTFFDDKNQNSSFYWLGQYMESCSPKNEIDPISGYNIWGWYLQSFINRKDLFYDMDIAHSYSTVDGVYPAKNFSTFGTPEHWRPYWTKMVCGLKDTMTYAEYMPVRWNWDKSCAAGTVDGVGTSTAADVTPENWYKWNKVSNISGLHDDTHILAWRKGSTNGPIVHRVDNNNIALYATYVRKNIDEKDLPADPVNLDATNDDLFQLLSNKNFVPDDTTKVPTHNLTVTRKLVAGMYNTICLPVNLDLGGLMQSHPLWYDPNGKGATVLEFTGITTTKNQAGEPVTILNFQQVTQTVAGVPYLVKLRDGAADYVDDMPFTTVSVYNDLHPIAPGGLIFQPTINPTIVPEGSIILVADDRLALTTDDGEMLGMRGYFTIDKSDPMWAADIAAQAADGRVYLSMKKPVTTSIPVAPEAEQPKQPKVRKVMHNGQIYILRGDEVYTITGNRVK